jgi:hypothetical protein
VSLIRFDRDQKKSSFLSFLLGFISSLPQFSWEKGFDVVVLSYAIISSLFVSVANLTKIQHDVAL